MKQIKKRRRVLRIGNPVGFSLFCLVCLAVLAGLYLGISWAIKNGPGVVKAMRAVVQEEVLTTRPQGPRLAGGFGGWGGGYREQPYRVCCWR